MKQKTDTNADKNSATGTASHIPFTPKTKGNNIIAKLKKTKVLSTIIIAAIFPLEKEVNIAAEKIFVPVKKKENAKIKKPFKAT